ncbi:DUF72 domain-containing protein [Streptomyces capparidis]
MGRVLVGTCSWTDKELIASGWYPDGVDGAEGRLRYYASRFPVVEVDATYYALPSVRNSRLWVERTPESFVLDVKAFSLLTGHPTPPSALPAALRPAGAGARLYPGDLPDAALDEVWERFLGALAPLAEAGKLGAVLAQFPPWFAPGPGAERRILECRDRCAPYRMSVEFRNAAWLAGERRAATLAFLRRHGLPYVSVDMPQGHPSSLPPVAEATAADLSVVRFHGRSPRWADGGRTERYRHRYTRDELRQWVPRIRELARGSEAVHVLMNNCCGDAAQRAAEEMLGLLDEDGVAAGAPAQVSRPVSPPAGP